MKMKALLLACAAAGAFASIALADGGHHGRHHEHGTTTTTTGTTTTGTTTTTTGATTTTTTPANCSRVGLRGTLATVSPTSFTLTITKVENDNDDESAATGPAVGSTVTIAVDANTRVQWDGVGTLIGPNVGDSARVKARSCGSPATFTAKSVKARSAHTAHDDSHHNAKSHK